MAFFVFETLTGQRLHPMQYLAGVNAGDVLPAAAGTVGT